MTDEEKQLLLKDLCTRTHYGVKCSVSAAKPPKTIVGIIPNSELVFVDKATIFGPTEEGYNIELVKPYLRPMSSMTDDEKKEIEEILEHSFHVTDKGNIVSNDWRDGAVFTSQYDAFKIMDFCNKHHLDCRELIPMGLALEAPKDMYIK